MKDNYDVFISYRREGGKEYARTIQQALEKKYRVFLDFDELEDGVFDQRIIDAISHSSVFLLLLTKGALNRCLNAEDWLRKEIMYAAKCRCHIVPVTIDDTFDGFPPELPEEVKIIVSTHQFSELQTKTLFKSSIKLLIQNRIEPYVHREETESGVEIHIEADVDCDLYRFKTFIRRLQEDEDNVIHLNPGNYKLEFRSTEYPEVKDIRKYSLASDVDCDYLEVNLKEKVATKRREVEEEEVKRKFEEKKAVLLRKAADQGNASAQNDLGLMYENGRGVPQSYAEAVKWYLKAAKQGNAIAQCNLGWMYEKGRGVKQSDTEAVNWYLKAAEQGNTRAQHNLGWKYGNGQGVTQSDTEALKWYAKAADQGYASAQNNLGLMYENGRGVPQSYAEAVKWYLKAAEQGDAIAQCNLGWMYEKGRGVKQSDTEAVNWYLKAAEQGHARAQYNLGLMYENGRGVLQSYSEAVNWYRKAAEQGHNSAKEKLKVLSKK